VKGRGKREEKWRWRDDLIAEFCVRYCGMQRFSKSKLSTGVWFGLVLVDLTVVTECCWLRVWQIKHRFRDDAMADDLDMSGLRLNGMPDVETPTIVNIDQSDVRTAFHSYSRMNTAEFLLT